MAGQQIGDIFLGVTPGPVRQYMREVFKNARSKYSRLVLPCCGRFAIAEVAIDAGWSPADIECSDVSLFTTVLGMVCAGDDLTALNIEFSGKLELLNEGPFRDADLAARVLFGLKLCQLVVGVPLPTDICKRMRARNHWRI